MNIYVERTTYRIWPNVPRDYSIETVAARWKDLEPLYHAARKREIQQAYAARGKQRAD